MAQATISAIALRAAQAGMIMMFFLMAPTFMSLLIRWGGEAVRQAMGW